MSFCKGVFHWKAVTAVATTLLLNVVFQLYVRGEKPVNPLLPAASSSYTQESRSLKSGGATVKHATAGINAPLPYVLLGIATMSADSVACIYNEQTGAQSVYRPYDHLDDYVVRYIAPGEVALERSGVIRHLLFAGKTPHAVDTEKELLEPSNNSNIRTISRSKAVLQLLKINELLTRLRILPLPDISTNTLKGFRIDNVPEGSMIEAAGIKDGDVIVSVQGMQLQSVQDAWQILGRMHKESRLEVVLLRNNQPVSLHYEIKN